MILKNKHQSDKDQEAEMSEEWINKRDRSKQMDDEIDISMMIT